MPKKIFTLAAASVMLSFGCSSAIAQDAAAGANVYKRCSVCHSTTGKISLGPPLNGVVGRKSGTVPKYTYSKAMLSKAFAWDSAILDKFLTKPQAVVPGTKMAFVGLSNAKDRQDLIAYLKTLKK